MPVLKVTEYSEEQEIKFEIQSLKTMTTAELFHMMFEKSKIMRDLLEKNGHTESYKIIKRK